MIGNWVRTFDNPVLVKEMRVGFREKKVFYALMAWVLIVAFVASLSSVQAFNDRQGIDHLPEAGLFFMEFMFWVQMGLLAMLAPSLTTSAVSGERERQSFDMLLTTHLSSPELILGKFGFAASFISLALFSTIPLEAIVFFLGGVSLPSFISMKLTLLSFGFLCALYGLMMSSRESRSTYATGQTYLGLLIICWFCFMGVATLRYAPDIPFLVYLATVLAALYLGLFLFWKSVNHLDSRARHLKILLGIGLVFYLLFLGLAMATQQMVPGIDDEVWVVSGPIHYLLLGLLLNPMQPSTRVERERFGQSILSKPLFWSTVLILGTFLPLLWCDDELPLAVCVYGLVAGLSTAYFARGLALGREHRYPQILGGCWLLFNIVPVFFATDGLEQHTHLWHPATISPLVMLSSYLERTPTQIPVLALGLYLVLLLAGIALHRHKAKRGT